MTIHASALLEIDVQNDFCPGGALEVPGGDRVIGPLNALALRFAQGGGRVVATTDWHPGDHVSFAASHPGKKSGDLVSYPGVREQILWPVHCVQGSPGAALHKALDLGPVHLILRKGCRKNLDSYSAFFENDQSTPTGLDGYLKSLGIGTVVLGGLATDYCVLYSALDARRLGYTAIVLRDAVRGVGIPQGSVERALAAMEAAGILLLDSGDLK